MSYELRFSPQFRKDLQRLDSALHRRILDALGKLRDTPYQGRKLAGVGVGKWRILIGDFASATTSNGMPFCCTGCASARTSIGVANGGGARPYRPACAKHLHPLPTLAPASGP